MSLLRLFQNLRAQMHYLKLAFWTGVLGFLERLKDLDARGGGPKPAGAP